MKIAFMVGQFPLLSETFILNQIAGVLDRGHEVDVYADQPPPGKSMHRIFAEYRLAERTHYRPPMPERRLARSIDALPLLLRLGRISPRETLQLLSPRLHGRSALGLRLLYLAGAHTKRRRYDVIHAHFAFSGLRAIHLRSSGWIGGPLLTTFHGHDVNRAPRLVSSDHYQPLFKQGERFTVNSGFTLEQAAHMGCPRERIRIMPMGLDFKHLAFAERHLLPGQPAHILSVGRLVEKKGHEYAIRAVTAAAQKHDLRYTIVGEGPERASLAALIEELGMRERIELVGGKTQDELRVLFDRSHLFVLASVTSADGDREGQALVLQEAQACGLPVLSTVHNGIPEGVVDGKSAFLTPERDVEAMSERLIMLLSEPQRWPAMGQAGRDFVERRYDLERLGDELVELYSEMTA